MIASQAKKVYHMPLRFSIGIFIFWFLGADILPLYPFFLHSHFVCPTFSVFCGKDVMPFVSDLWLTRKASLQLPLFDFP